MWQSLTVSEIVHVCLIPWFYHMDAGHDENVLAASLWKEGHRTPRRASPCLSFPAFYYNLYCNVLIVPFPSYNLCTITLCFIHAEYDSH